MVIPPQQDGTPPGDAAQDEPTDAELIARSIDDPRAFMPLVARHQRVLFGYLARRVGRDLAEDVTSETFTRAFAQRHRFDQDRPDARPWLFGIATNLLRNHTRSQVRQTRAYLRHGLDPDATIDEAGLLAKLDASTQSPALAAAIEALKPGDREALLLYAWNEMSYEDIADALDIPVGTVRSRLNRARRIVKEHLDTAGAAVDPGEARSGRA